jgi:16S rRNA processing protein RimM
MTADRDPNQSPNSRTGDAGATLAGDWALVGEIVGVFGIRGELKVHPQSDYAERFAPGSAVYLGTRHERRVITACRVHGAQVILAIEGCATANDAERLRGQRLTIPTSELAALPTDQFYQHDIIGLRVELLDGRALGVISDIIPSSASDLYVVRDPATGQERLLPAVKEFIHDVDLAARVMRVTPIPGLFDEDAEEAR